MTDDEKYYYSLEEFFKTLDGLIGPIYNLSKIKREHTDELKEVGLLHEDRPKWARRQKGEKRPSDRWDYGEKT